MIPIRLLSAFVLTSVLTLVSAWGTGIDVRELKLAGDGKTDDTAALQAALDSGKTGLYFSAGTYLLGAIKVPADSRLQFDPRAKIIPVPEKISYTKEVESDGKKKKVPAKYALFTIVGDRVRLEGLRYDYSAGATEKDPVPVTTLVYAEKVSDSVVSGFYVERSSKDELKRGSGPIRLFEAKDCKNVVMENSGATGVGLMFYTLQCSNVISRGNWMIGGATMTTFAFGSESLRHHDNWSRGVGYQCVWRGGSPDPSRKHPKVPHGTANVVHRDVRLEDPKFIPHTRGVYDVMVQNNYAEYGTVLCWGNKARQVLVDGNTARFMFDYAYGSEGDENVIYSNNISVNSCVAGIMSLYWGEKMLITGNLIIVRHEPFIPEFAKPKPEGFYMGQFIRLHHGPANPEDKYGTGGVMISNNLFVNELADRPSGISIEAGRDVLFSNNKVINGLLRKSDELGRVKASEVDKDMDEFASTEAGKNDKGEDMVVLRRTGTDLSRVTITGNEFITRQPGDKPMVLINGSVSLAAIKNNVFRKEDTYLKFTDEQKAKEKDPSRFVLFSEDDVATRELSNSKPATAIGIAPFTGCMTLVQDNFIYGWANAITAEDTAVKGKTSFVVTGNTTDGVISVKGDGQKVFQKVEGNIEIPKGLMP